MDTAVGMVSNWWNEGSIASVIISVNMKALLSGTHHRN